MEASQVGPAERVRELLERIAEAAGVPAQVEIHEDSESLTAAYVGDDLGLLIGRHGQTIDAIQHLSYRAAPWSAKWCTSTCVTAAASRPTARVRSPSATSLSRRWRTTTRTTSLSRSERRRRGMVTEFVSRFS